MKPGTAVRDQFRSTWPWILAIIAVSAVLLSLVVFITVWQGASFYELTGDPVAVAEVPFYTGFLSQVGMFIWAATAAVCLFSGAILCDGKVSGRIRTFLLLAGGISLYLGLDDVFMLHETVLPVHMGIPEPVAYATYGAVLCVFVVVFLRTILGTGYVILCMAAFFFAASIAVDMVMSEPTGFDPHLLEDGAKLVALVCWLAYFSQTAAAAVQQSMAPPVAHPASPRSKTP